MRTSFASGVARLFSSSPSPVLNRSVVAFVVQMPPRTPITPRHALLLLLTAVFGCAPTQTPPPSADAKQLPDADAHEHPGAEPSAVELVPVPAGYTCAEPRTEAAPAPPDPLPVQDEAAVVDPVACTPGAAAFAFPMGSHRVEVKGVRDGACEVIVSAETEGASTTWTCALPQKGPKVRIGRETPLPKPCRKTGSGNDLLAVELPKKLGVTISGDGFVTRVQETREGESTALAAGGSVDLQVRFYADQAFSEPIRDDGQPVSLALEDESGPGLFEALLDDTDRLHRARIGSVRRIILREEVARALSGFGPFDPQAALCVEIEVVGYRPAP